MDRAHANLAFLRGRREALQTLGEAELETAVREALPSLSDPPTPEEAVSLAASLGADDFPALCLALSRAVGTRSKDKLFSAGDAEAGWAAARIAYLPNAFSDRAYRRFASAFASVAAVYFAGFREVAEEVYSGRCSYAILPVASSSEGAIPSFRRLIERYDLKIAAATDVALDDERTMRFALLRRGLPPPPYTASYLELSAVPTDGMSAGTLLSSLEKFGAEVVSVNSHPSGPEEDRNVLDLTFDLRGADPFALYLFLEGSHARYETVGSYEII